jgi:hypothetical protein
MKAKKDGIKKLFDRLEQLPAAGSMEEAHLQISKELELIEDERLGIPLRDSMNLLGNERMMLAPLTPEYWSGIEDGIAIIKLNGGMSTHLYEDGTMEFRVKGY